MYWRGVYHVPRNFAACHSPSQIICEESSQVRTLRITLSNVIVVTLNYIHASSGLSPLFPLFCFLQTSPPWWEKFLSPTATSFLQHSRDQCIGTADFNGRLGEELELPLTGRLKDEETNKLKPNVWTVSFACYSNYFLWIMWHNECCNQNH